MRPDFEVLIRVPPKVPSQTHVAETVRRAQKEGKLSEAHSAV